MSRWVVVLAGGVGSRFWPLSTPDRPKQLLPLITDQPLLVDTLARMEPLAPAARTLVLTNATLRDAVMRVAPALPPENVIAEPRPAGTAGALAWAASEIERRPDGGRDATMISVHADWAIADERAYRATLVRGAELAERTHALVTVGVVPTRPDPGFGYIRPGPSIATDAFRVDEFVEKPQRDRAERMVGDGCLWNSGMFVWTVGDFLDEVRALTPEVAPALAAAQGDIDRYFALVRSVPVDVGVLERSSRVAVIPGAFGWDDVGTWAALARVRRRDACGNAVSGDVHLVESHDNVVHAEGSDVVLYGVRDLVVVSRDGVTLVTTRERSTDLKQLIDALPPSLRDRR